MKKLLFIFAPLAIMGCKNYSPLDNWIEEHNKQYEENRKDRQSNQQFIDSLKLIENVRYYHVGDTLLPSYACPDTLIVTNENGINYGMGLIEQGIIDASDYQIDSILHSNCRQLSILNDIEF